MCKPYKIMSGYVRVCPASVYRGDRTCPRLLSGGRAPFILLLIRRIFAWLRNTALLGTKIAALERRAHLKGRVVRKYRLPGLVILVAIPLPGTGAWTGSLVAALMGVRMKHAVPAIFLGVAAAGAIMLALSLGVSAVIT